MIVGVTCCDTDRCNLPTESSAVPNAVTVHSTVPHTSTVPNTITHTPTQHVPSCVKDIVIIVQDFWSHHTHLENATPYVTAFLKELVARLPIGQTDSLLELSLIDTHIHKVWSLTDYLTNNRLQTALNDIPFKKTSDILDINDLVLYLSSQAFGIGSGDRPNVPNTVVIFVDQRARLHGHVIALGNVHSTDIVIVNIGSAVHSAVSQIATLATGSHHVLSVAGYNALHGIKDTLVNLICN
ncbi:uncharacterized protein LOC127855530 [Dreissena polymorpha]|nr:uncharacterized protein LOC127855530 [Dreissena polymorpha]